MTTPVYVFREPMTAAGKLALFDHLLNLRGSVGEFNLFMRKFPTLTEENGNYVLRVRVEPIEGENHVG